MYVEYALSMLSEDNDDENEYNMSNENIRNPNIIVKNTNKNRNTINCSLLLLKLLINTL